MKYALSKVVNGNFSIVSEHGEDKQAAFVAFHDQSKILWNASDVITATVAVIDENQDVVDGKKEYISQTTESAEE